MRREERVSVQGPVKEQQPDGMSHRGGTAIFEAPSSADGRTKSPQASLSQWHLATAVDGRGAQVDGTCWWTAFLKLGGRDSCRFYIFWGAGGAGRAIMADTYIAPPLREESGPALSLWGICHVCERVAVTSRPSIMSWALKAVACGVEVVPSMGVCMQELRKF